MSEQTVWSGAVKPKTTRLQDKQQKRQLTGWRDQVLKVLGQCGQGIVAAIGDFEALLFLSCLHCSAAAILLASWDFAPL